MRLWVALGLLVAVGCGQAEGDTLTPDGHNAGPRLSDGLYACTLNCAGVACRNVDDTVSGYDEYADAAFVLFEWCQADNSYLVTAFWKPGECWETYDFWRRPDQCLAGKRATP